MELTITQYNELHSKFNTLSEEHAQAITKINYLEIQVENLLSLNQQTKLEIRNVPVLKNENLTKIVHSIQETVGLSHEPLDSLNVYRSKVKQKPIIVEFASKNRRDVILNAVKKYNLNNVDNKINTNNIGILSEKMPIFINELLTPTARKIFYIARKIQMNKGYKFCWTSKGKILLKAKEGSPTIAVQTIAQAEALLEDKSA